MQCLCWPLFLLAVPFQVETGRSAEPPIKCKLNLVRLEPLPRDKPCPENERLLRSTVPQSFYMKVENNVVDKGSKEAETNFRAIVRKEPKEYQAEHPLRAVATFGGKQFGFVLDKQSKKSQGYDRLYFDLNGNGDLTDDVPIDSKTAENIQWGNFIPAAFPRVDFKIHAEGTEWDYSFFLDSDTTIHEKNLSIGAWLVPAAYREGEIVLRGSKHKIVLLDGNASGRFDSSATFTSKGEDFITRSGTEILFDHEVLVGKHLGFTYLSEHRQALAKMNALGGKFYKIKVTPGGDELTCTPVAVPMGKITMPHTPCNVWLISEQGFLALNLRNDTPVDIPAGKWHLVGYTLWQFDGGTTGQVATNKSGTDTAAPTNGVSKAPKIIYMSSFDGFACKPITVVANQTTTMKIGPPYTPTLTVVTKGKVVPLALEVRGIGHEKVDCEVAGITQSKPKFKITDPQGKVVEQGNFDYG